MNSTEAWERKRQKTIREDERVYDVCELIKSFDHTMRLKALTSHTIETFMHWKDGSSSASVRAAIHHLVKTGGLVETKQRGRKTTYELAPPEE